MFDAEFLQLKCELPTQRQLMSMVLASDSLNSVAAFSFWICKNFVRWGRKYWSSSSHISLVLLEVGSSTSSSIAAIPTVWRNLINSGTPISGMPENWLGSWTIDDCLCLSRLVELLPVGCLALRALGACLVECIFKRWKKCKIKSLVRLRDKLLTRHKHTPSRSRYYWKKKHKLTCEDIHCCSHWQQEVQGSYW